VSNEDFLKELAEEIGNTSTNEDDDDKDSENEQEQDD
jgi:hypothetical protein